MDKPTVVVEELHITVRMPADLPDDEADRVRRALAGIAFVNRVRRAVRAALAGFPDLAATRIAVTR